MQLDGLLSIRALVPLEEGGSTARQGFIYQDHIAAHYCIRMLSTPSLREIWCEAEDDITLIWLGSDGERVELVQVKSDNLNQLWSSALVCGEKDNSIAAKSLAHDRCAEPCTFRLVTKMGVNGDLSPLKRPLDHEDREFKNPTMLALHKDVSIRLGDLLSPRLRTASHWLGSLVWTVAESEKAVEDRNLHVLDGWLESIGEALFSDQRRDLYERILRRVMKASLPKWKDDAEAKKLHRELFITWLKGQIAEVKGILTGTAGEILRGKMEAAGIEQGVIETAEDLRRRHRRSVLDPKYMAPPDTAEVETEAIATLNLMLSRLDSGMTKASGVTFHAACLEALAELKIAYPGTSLNTLQAVMYVAAERCRHRFLPVGA